MSLHFRYSIIFFCTTPNKGKFLQNKPFVIFLVIFDHEKLNTSLRDFSLIFSTEMGFSFANFAISLSLKAPRW